LIASTPRITNIEDGKKHLIYEEPIENEDGTINSKIKKVESDIEKIFTGNYDYVEESDDSKSKTSITLFDKIKEMSDAIKNIEERIGQLEAKATI
jgi:ABC-type Zn2+ transport system substrate-binding protein/surface adhesin